MVFKVPQFWDIAIDGVQMILYLSILGLYIRNRAIHKSYKVIRPKIFTEQNFNAHVFSLTVQQQISQAFTNITETIADERNNLENVLELNSLSSEGDDISNMQSNSKLPINHNKYPISDDRTGSATRCDKILKFSAKGLDAKNIAESLKFPIGEVELILSLQEK